ncbi:RNA-binding protein [cyanobiont of Ornithocercus magnificus]|nr:RNA-binding protein [cyanobiont of Ornithocercus magnificus]
MSIRLYFGNLPQTFESKELEEELASIVQGIRFKPVLDRGTGSCRGFGFATVNDEKMAEAVIEHFNGRNFNGSALRVERSERREAGNSSRRNSSVGNQVQGSQRRVMNKVVHSDAPAEDAPDPRWGGELSKLKQLLESQKTIA